MDCTGYATMNYSLLSWINPEIPLVIALGKKSNGIGHAMVLTNKDKKNIITDNNLIYTYEDDILNWYIRSDSKEELLLENTGLYDLDTYNPLTKSNSIALDMTILQNVNKTFNKELESKNDAKILFNLDLSKGNAIELSDDVLLQLYKICSEAKMDISYEHAKYAYHTIYVKNPEYYIQAYIGKKPNGRAYINSPILYDFLKDINGFDDLIEATKIFDNESIYKEDHRLMTPEYILLFNTADLRSKAFFIQSCLEYLNIDSYGIITEKNSYVAIQIDKQLKYFNLSNNEYVNNIEENVELIISRDEVYYPIMNKNTLSPSANEFFLML